MARARPGPVVVAGIVAVTAAVLVVMAACSSTPSAAPPPTTSARLRVVATTTVLGDLARAIAGDRADVTTLMGPDDDPRRFALAPDRQAELDGADVVVQVASAYEVGLAPALDQARQAGVTVYEAAPPLSPVTGADGQPDFHVWTDPDRLTTMADQVARLLADRSHTDPGPWLADAATYAATLAGADEAAQAAMNPLPDDHRVLVTSSTGLTYLAQRYDFTVRAPGTGEAALTVDVDALRPDPPGPASNAALIIDATRSIAAWLGRPAPPG